LPLSVRKLKEVYQDNKRELQIQVGLSLYRQAAAAVGGPAAATSPAPAAASGHEASDDALSGSDDEPPLSAPSRLQLALLPAQAVVPAQTGSLVPRGQRAPMAHLLSLVPAKRKFTPPGVWCCWLQHTLLTATN
jgi:hypothetical protein